MICPHCGGIILDGDAYMLDSCFIDKKPCTSTSCDSNYCSKYKAWKNDEKEIKSDKPRIVVV